MLRTPSSNITKLDTPRRVLLALSRREARFADGVLGRVLTGGMQDYFRPLEAEDVGMCLQLDPRADSAFLVSTSPRACVRTTVAWLLAATMRSMDHARMRSCRVEGMRRR